MRSKNRALTQKISRRFFDEGAAGIKFRSHLDENPCYAYFEFRAQLVQCGTAIPLSGAVPELLAVCKEYGLRL